MRVLLLIAICVAIYYAHGALSAEQPLVFRRDTITIVPPPKPQIQELSTETQEKTDTPEPRQPVAIKAEIRSEQVLRLDWVHSLGSLRDDMGMLILFDPPTNRPLARGTIYSPVDVLFVNSEGRILQIAPDINLSQLQDTVSAKEPARAWLYLQGGASEALGIRPGDRLEHPLFSPRPVVLE